ncbi:hypothetical protein K501DRAFT_286146 [Backusella circina FSU 941]|nr:hypothetical protein K501DRAFT_286146 [Backusella circina FSU 941]
MLRSLISSHRFYSTIPFDTKPFPFQRFEPCCPATDYKEAPNGFVPCKKHPLPNVLGKKIEFQAPMTRPNSKRHVMACVGPDAIEWTRAKVESIPGLIQSFVKTRLDFLKLDTNEPDKVVMTTISDRPSEANSPDVIFFPDFKIIRSVDTTLSKGTDIRKTMEQVWTDPSLPIPADVKTAELEKEAVILVCTHERRDMRCGRIGPLVIEEFKRVLKEKSLDDKVEVWGVSHFGGHTFAGNVIIHQRQLGGQLYGNVRQCHVDAIVDRHIISKKVIKELWRGQVTPAKEDML